VQRYASALAQEMCAADALLIEAVRTAALLHDIGKLAIPDRLLHKPGRAVTERPGRKGAKPQRNPAV